jgi:hypothetical protein
MKAIKNDTKKVFWKKGTCSQTFCYLLDREFGHLKENEERALDPLAGGIMQRGQQCGMLWGASLAAGAEAFRRHNDRDQAIAIAITTTQRLLGSFEKRAKSVNCRDIIGSDFTGKFGLAKAFLLGRFMRCFRLADKWAPEAIQSAIEGLSVNSTDLSQLPVSCASEVAKKMGASAEEIVMVAGFAGGLGLSGNGCGALAAAVWITILEMLGKDNWKYSLSDPVSGKILKKFHAATAGEITCHKITGRRFKTIAEHTEFIKNNGCENLMNVLARA